MSTKTIPIFTPIAITPTATANVSPEPTRLTLVWTPYPSPTLSDTESLR